MQNLWDYCSFKVYSYGEADITKSDVLVLVVILFFQLGWSVQNSFIELKVIN